jgi:hypothetical protein
MFMEAWGCEGALKILRSFIVASVGSGSAEADFAKSII